MWNIKVALNRPYTFIVLGLLILLVSSVASSRTPADIFPNINIPVIAVSWTYTGLNPEEMEGRITSVYERLLTTLVDNYLQVITAQTTTLTNQRYEIDIQRRRMDASVLLIKALGGGWDINRTPSLSSLKKG